MSTEDSDTAAFSQQLDQRLRFLLDELGPDETRTFVQQAKAELGDEATTNDEEALARLNKLDGIMAPYLLRAIGKVVERLERNLNTVLFTDPLAPAATIRDADAPRTRSGKGRKQKA
jgi:hypothetical protein